MVLVRSSTMNTVSCLAKYRKRGLHPSCDPSDPRWDQTTLACDNLGDAFGNLLSVRGPYPSKWLVLPACDGWSAVFQNNCRPTWELAKFLSKQLSTTAHLAVCDFPPINAPGTHGWWAFSQGKLERMLFWGQKGIVQSRGDTSGKLQTGQPFTSNDFVELLASMGLHPYDPDTYTPTAETPGLVIMEENTTMDAISLTEARRRFLKDGRL